MHFLYIPHVSIYLHSHSHHYGPCVTISCFTALILAALQNISSKSRKSDALKMCICCVFHCLNPLITPY